jgi:oligopeptidase A
MWDVAFYERRLKEQKFAYREDELKQYFSLPKVLQGLFDLVRKLFGIVVLEVKAEERKELGVTFWCDDCQFFKVMQEEKDGAKTKLVGPVAYFYADFFARPGTKDSGAWMDSILGKTSNERLVQQYRLPPQQHVASTFQNGAKPILPPVAVIVCNQAPPVYDASDPSKVIIPSLMTHDDVEVLFHEFGHALQHMLTTETEGLAAGSEMIEWDAIELPSQFMENFCYHKATIDTFAFHHETNELIPEELFRKVKQAKTFQAGSHALDYINSAMVDLELHDSKNDFRMNYAKPDLLEHIWQRAKRVSAITHDLAYGSAMQDYETRYLATFHHSFNGDSYAAGYYSYLWAEVLSADAFAAFEEAGLENLDELQRLGRLFRNTILALGGGEDPARIFKEFRGRAASVEPLLRHRGLDIAC